MLPSETLVGPSEKNAPGRKVNKQRVTFMPCSNVTGDHKLRMVVIGKSKNPRAFKNVKVPVTYFASRNAWMTQDIFKTWFHKDFVPAVRRFSAASGIPPRAILLLDNCSAHHMNDDLKSEDDLIIAYFLPPNVTAMIQPMDQNVIQNCKLRYREKLLLHVMARSRENDIDQCLNQISMKDVCFWIHDAWTEVQNTVIQLSWRKIGVIFNDKLVHEDDVPLTQLLNIDKSENTMEPHIVEERYVSKAYTDEDILSMVLDDQSASEELEQLELNFAETAPGSESAASGSYQQDESPEVINDIEAVRMLDKIVDWADASDLSIDDVIFFRRIREIALKKSM
ncbi:jerky protein homolog-like [Wyeomyia smithii]|uniref:jerky protein homolog-like n=1 Tax=Wyeomyia smithii TaxID=174621 RepID=UPI002467D522|nr:jerky protein homolog-like [Wyeomyia smithii]